MTLTTSNETAEPPIFGRRRQFRRVVPLGAPRLFARIVTCALVGFAWSAAAFLSAVQAGDPSNAWKAGAAKVAITPAEPIWMAGYASRDKPAEGKLQDLYAKALAIEDPQGTRLVLITTDLVGLPKTLADAVADEITRTCGLRRSQVLLTSSHTHCGPVVEGGLVDMYDLSLAEAAKVHRYTEDLHRKLVGVARQALADVAPANLSWGNGRATFAVNRRPPIGKGPVDHDVPVLKVSSPDGKLRGVVFGYACHNTTLQFYQWCGDYAGFAQANLEQQHPGATAMFFAGCGGDANPLPRSTVELCEKYGRQLSDAVESVLSSALHPVTGSARPAFAVLDLPLDRLPSRDDLQRELTDKNSAVRRRAARLVQLLADKGSLDATYPYPVQVWRLGPDLTLVALGGEAVVDYSLRLKRELAAPAPSSDSQQSRAGKRADGIWVAAYANDVMAYIPSLRVLREGGYEGATAMIYYGLPTSWAPAVEELIIAKVRELAETTRAPVPGGSR